MSKFVYSGKSAEQRIADRLRNSGGDLPADVRTKTGDGPQRVFHNVHHAAANRGAKRHDDEGGTKPPRMMGGGASDE